MVRKPKAAPRRRPRKGRGAKPRGTKVEHACGHAQAHELPKLKWQKEAEKKRLAAQSCTLCWASNKAEEAEQAAGLEELPELTGTPRQVAWARSIRGQALVRLRLEAARLDAVRKERELESASSRFLALVFPAALERTVAKWWIEAREGINSGTFLGDAARDEVAALWDEGFCPF